MMSSPTPRGSSASASTSPPTDLIADPHFSELFQKIEARFSSACLGSERWYILVLACITAGPDPEAAVQLYLYLIAQPQHNTTSSRQRLVRRLREVLVKAVSIVGVCKPIEAVLSIAAVERREDRDHSCTRAGWQSGGAGLAEGRAWFRQLYAGNGDDALALFDAHRDFAWISEEITYGLYLGDRQVLDDLDTQMVVLPGIMMQDLPRETRWHIRGTRRVGVSMADVQVAWDCVQMVAEHFTVRLRKVPTVEEVESEV